MRGRMSAVFMLVVTSGPRLGDVESGLAASALGAQAAVVTGGLACVVSVGLTVLGVPAARGLRRAPPDARHARAGRGLTSQHKGTARSS